MRRFWLCLGLGILAALNGCVTSPPLLLDKASQPDEIDYEHWKSYGAVYEYDEFRIQTELLNPKVGWTTYYYVNRMIRILNRKGVDHGTIYIGKYADHMVEFNVKLWDPKGKPVSLDQEAIRQKYLQTEEIIVPKVEPNCRIGIKLVFRGDNLAYSWEHWFEKEIPVLKGRFSIFYPGRIKYDCKTYGGVTPVKKQRFGSFFGYIWDHENIVPEDDIFENRWHIDREPHIMARILRWSWGHQINYKAPGWHELARKYKAFFMSPSIFTSKSALKKIASGIIRDKKGDFEKADAILAYVQDNITLDKDKELNLNTVYLNQILRNKSGDPWDIALLLNELLKAGGFATHVYVTQQKQYGGFDPDFPTWRYLNLPLIAVEINDKQLVAWPYERFMGLGEYPFGFHDLQALTLEEGEILPVPASIHQTAKRISSATLSTAEWEDTHPWQFIYKGHYASYIRVKMSERTPKKRKAYFKSLVRVYDKENSLEDADLDTFNRQGDIEVNLECRNTGSKTQGPKADHFSLRPWFRKYFVDYDKSRKANYTNDRILVYEDSVLIKGNQDRRQSYHFKCTRLDNALFSTVCEEKQTDEGMRLSRQLTVKQADLTPEQMQKIHPDIISLNRIDESYVIEKP